MATQDWPFIQSTFQKAHALEVAAGDTVGGGSQSDGKGEKRFKIRDLFPEARCTRPIMDRKNIGIDSDRDDLFKRDARP